MEIQLVLSHSLPTHPLCLLAEPSQILRGIKTLQNNYAPTNLTKISCWETSLTNASTEQRGSTTR